MTGSCDAKLADPPSAVSEGLTRPNSVLRLSRALLIVTLLAASYGARAQASADVQAAERDHQLMMQRLGIRALRPPRNADANAPNAANYDEAKANPFPRWPDPLVRNDGHPVTTPDGWARRRRELIELFEREAYGRVPMTPRIEWSVTAPYTPARAPSGPR